jgi:hypothetical protein
MAIENLVSKDLIGAAQRKLGIKAGDQVAKTTAETVVKSSGDQLLHGFTAAQRDELKVITAYHRIPRIVQRDAAALDRQFPIYMANKAYADQLVNGVQGDSKFLVQELIRVTDPGSGTHKIAKGIANFQETAPSIWDLYRLAAGNGELANSLTLSDAEVAQRLAGLASRSTHDWSPDVRKGAIDYLRQLPNLPESAKNAIAAGDAKVEQIMKGAVKEPNALAKLFGATPKTVVTSDIQAQINATHLTTLKTIGNTLQPHAAGFNPAAEQQALMRQLLDLKLNKPNGWQVWSAEDWAKFQSTTRTAGSSVSEVDASSVKKGIFRRTEDSSAVATLATNGQSTTNAAVVSAVDTPIPGTGVAAPPVSAQTILANPRDYIVLSNGQLHTLSSTAPDGWFALAAQDLKAKR